MIFFNPVLSKTSFFLGSSVDYLEEEYVDLDWNEEEDDVTSKASETTPPPPALKASKAEALKSPPPKNNSMKKRIFDENHLEGSGGDQDLGDDEDLLLEGSATTERYNSEDSVAVDLGNIFLGGFELKKKPFSEIFGICLYLPNRNYIHGICME